MPRVVAMCLLQLAPWGECHNSLDVLLPAEHFTSEALAVPICEFEISRNMPGISRAACPLAEDAVEESLELLQHKGVKVLAGKAAAASTPDGARWSGLLRAFRKLFFGCHPSYGNPESCAIAMRNSAGEGFDFLHHRSKLNLTTAEASAFRIRFQKALAEASKVVQGRKFIWQRFGDWRKMAAQSYLKMQPVVPRALVHFVQASNLGWKAEIKEEHITKSVHDFEQMLGLDENATDQEEHSAEAMSPTENFVETGPQRDYLEPIGPYDVATRWPECRVVAQHVRFQTCPNCWSHATALVAETQVCIKTGGRFRGRDAWLSQSYAAACRIDGRNYCDSGPGTLGFKTVTMWGVPTGASNDEGNASPSARTCYPQIPAGLSGITCPVACRDKRGYPRTLQSDTFWVRYSSPRSLSPFVSDTQLLVKRALMEDGPVIIGFRAYQDLLAYVSGIYRPAQTTWNRSIGGHAVTGMGFGPGYWLCTNSWGDTWGQKGQFKLATKVVNIGFYLSGPLTYGKYGHFPVPVP